MWGCKPLYFLYVYYKPNIKEEPKMNKKKISVEVEGLGKVEGNIPEEVANTIMMLTVEELQKMVFKSPRLLLPADVLMNTEDDEMMVGVALDRTTDLSMCEQLCEDEPIKLGVLDYNPFESNEYFTNSRLVVHKCKECGKLTVRRMHLRDSNITHCHWCKHEYAIHTVARVDVKCTSCNSEYYVWTADELPEIECKDCKAPNDLVYYDNSRKGCTTNIRY